MLISPHPSPDAKAMLMNIKNINKNSVPSAHPGAYICTWLQLTNHITFQIIMYITTFSSLVGKIIAFTRFSILVPNDCLLVRNKPLKSTI